MLEGTVSVAVKRLFAAIVNPRNLERLQREMMLLAEVRHPNLVQFIGAVFDQSPPLIITELLDMNLRQAYEQKQLDQGNRLSIFMDIARALNYLHQRYDPIIHRDVSAPNVLLQRMPNHQWKGKVSDLGSANFLQDSGQQSEHDENDWHWRMGGGAGGNSERGRQATLCCHCQPTQSGETPERNDALG